MSLKLILHGNSVHVYGNNFRDNELINQVTQDSAQLRLFKLGKFPLGLLADVESNLLIANRDYDVIDRRVFKKVRYQPFLYLDDPPLRTYQSEATTIALRRKRGIISIPPGTGKTRIAEAIIGILRKPTVFYVNRERLLSQTITEFERMFRCRIGKVAEGKIDIRPITVAMVQTVSKLPSDLFTNFSIAIFDEAHHVAADSIFDIAQHTVAPYCFGLTATPEREDGNDLLLQAAIGRILYHKTLSEMIENRWLARPELYTLHPDPMVFSKRDTYADVIQRAITHNRQRNQLIASTAINESLTGKTYIHVQRVAHGPLILKEIKNLSRGDKTIKAEWLYGSQKQEDKDEKMKRFTKGDVNILVSTLLGEGVDMPELYCLINATGGGKGIKVSLPQLMGRLLRPSRHMLVKYYDIVDHCKFLVDHFEERLRYYASEPSFIKNDYLRERIKALSL